MESIWQALLLILAQWSPRGWSLASSYRHLAVNLLDLPSPTSQPHFVGKGCPLYIPGWRYRGWQLMSVLQYLVVNWESPSRAALVLAVVLGPPALLAITSVWWLGSRSGRAAQQLECNCISVCWLAKAWWAFQLQLSGRKFCWQLPKCPMLLINNYPSQHSQSSKEPWKSCTQEQAAASLCCQTIQSA